MGGDGDSNADYLFHYSKEGSMSGRKEIVSRKEKIYSGVTQGAVKEKGLGGNKNEQG